MPTRVGKRSRINTLNSDILTKTQIALEAIKRQDEGIHPNIFTHYDPYSLQKQLNDDYCRLATHKKIRINQFYRVQVFPFTQEYYYLDMQEYTFPMRVIVKDIRASGTLFVGYDRKHPGIEKYSSKESQEPQPSYDFKATLSRECLLTLKKKRKRFIDKVYFSFAAQGEFFMAGIKVEFIGFNGMKETDSPELKRTTVSANKIDPIKTIVYNNSFKSIRNARENLLLLQSTFNNSPMKETISNEFKRSSNEALLTPINGRKETQPMPIPVNRGKLPQFIREFDDSEEKQKKQKDFLKSNYFGIKKEAKSMKDLRIKEKIDRSMQKAKKASQKKEVLVEHREKQREYNELALSCKKMIEEEQKTYRDALIRKRKLNQRLVPIIYVAKFLNVSRLFQERLESKHAAEFQVMFYVSKFVRKLKKAYGQSCSQIPARRSRNCMGALLSVSTGAKVIHTQANKNAAKVAYTIFKSLLPALTLNHSFHSAAKYRLKIKHIQRSWLTRYRAIKTMLKFFSRNHVEKMTSQYDYLKTFAAKFEAENVGSKIVKEYIADESTKFKHIFNAYKRKVQEIEEMGRINKEMISKIKKQDNLERQLLEVPIKPPRPQCRYFRNTDILKSMLRSWFEIQYKKWNKKQKASKY